METTDRTIEPDVEIPANTAATVYLLASSAKNMTVGGLSLAKVKDVQLPRIENGLAVLTSGARKYEIG